MNVQSVTVRCKDHMLTVKSRSEFVWRVDVVCHEDKNDVSVQSFVVRSFRDDCDSILRTLCGSEDLKLASVQVASEKKEEIQADSKAEDSNPRRDDVVLFSHKFWG